MTQHLALVRDEELLAFPVTAGTVRAALLLQPDADSAAAGTLLLALIPPDPATRPARPRDVVFLLDRSGSMEGWRLPAVTRGVASILETLREPDRFALYAFDDHVELPASFERGRLYPATPEHRAQALAFLRQLTPRRGTEMAEVLELAAATLADPGHDRGIFLITDGQSGNEEQILRSLGEALAGVRVFALGVERAVSVPFLRYLADLGGGAFELADSESQLHEVFKRFHRSLADPLLTDLRLQTDGFHIVEDTPLPLRLPDLYAGTPVAVLGRWQGEAAGSVQLLAEEQGRPWSATIPVRLSDDPAIQAAWTASRPPATPPAGANGPAPVREDAVESSRIDPRRRAITCEVEADGERRVRELPFVVGVLADLSGHPREPLPPLKQRTFEPVDRENFDAVLQAAGARLALQVPDRLAADGSSLSLELTFERLTDFGPARILEHLPSLHEPRRERQVWATLLHLVESNARLEELLARVFDKPERATALAALLQEPKRALILLGQMDVGKPEQALEGVRHALERVGRADHRPTTDVVGTLREWVAALDRRLSAQVAAVLHHPDFRRLEATWRGLHFLVRHVPPDANVVVRVLNASRRDLVKDMVKSPEFDQSPLFRLVYEAEYGRAGGEPFGLLLGDYEFGPHGEDLALLKRIAHVAAAAHAPFVAAAGASLLGVERFADLPPAAELEGRVAGGWNAFREADVVNHVGLTLPHVLARAPAAACDTAELGFAFDEFTDRGERPWMSAAWAFAGRAVAAFVRDGGFGRCCRPPDEGEAALPGDVAEITLSGPYEPELTRLGFLLLGHDPERDVLRFRAAPSCQKPRPAADPKAEQAAAYLSGIDHLLGLGRFLRALKLMAGGRLAAQPVKQCEQSLNDWLAQYVGQEGDLFHLLDEGRVEIRDIRGRPTLIAWLRPIGLGEEAGPLLRLTTEAPRRTAS
jgi:type VI secretion system protein ImpC